MYKLVLDIKPIVDMIKQINRVESEISPNLDRTAQAARDTVMRRIVERGENSEGVKMLTSSRRKLGRYSLGHGKRRQKRGLTVERITLLFNGNMMRAFQQLPNADKRRSDVGFTNNAADEIADYNEQRFGPAFYLSKFERQATGDFYVRAFNNFFK